MHNLWTQTMGWWKAGRGRVDGDRLEEFNGSRGKGTCNTFNNKKIKKHFIRKFDYWCATILKLNFTIYIKAIGPPRPGLQLHPCTDTLGSDIRSFAYGHLDNIFVCLFCFVAFCTYAHQWDWSVIFLFHSVPIREPSFFFQSLQSILFVRLESFPWMVGGMHHWNHVGLEILFWEEMYQSEFNQRNRISRRYIEMYCQELATWWWGLARKPKIYSTGCGTLWQELKLPSTGGISSSRKHQLCS